MLQSFLLLNSLTGGIYTDLEGRGSEQFAGDQSAAQGADSTADFQTKSGGIFSRL